GKLCFYKMQEQLFRKSREATMRGTHDAIVREWFLHSEPKSSYLSGIYSYSFSFSNSCCIISSHFLCRCSLKYTSESYFSLTFSHSSYRVCKIVSYFLKSLMYFLFK